MLYNPPLLERGRNDFHPKAAIDESIRGVEFNLYYTGKRRGTGSQIELHVTSIVRDWEENVYMRKAWFSGNRKTWKDAIRNHLKQHLEDLGTERLLTRRLLREFEITDKHYKKWDDYHSGKWDR